MPKVNNAYQVDRDRSINVGAKATFIVDSVGWGTTDTADGAGPSYTTTKLGGGSGNNAGGQVATNSYWKTSTDVTKTTGNDGTSSPFWQLEATWIETEISTSAGQTVILFEVGSSAGSLAGTNPANNDGTRLYTRKRVGGTSGLGKALADDTPIPMADGTTRWMGALVEGDFVLGSDGKPTEVIAVYPQGERELYDVLFDDGSVVTADGEHIWNTAKHSGDAYKNVTTLEIMNSEKGKWYIPMTEPVEGNSVVPLDAYTLGVLLGDGCLTGKEVTFTVMDSEIVEGVRDNIPEGLKIRVDGALDNKCPRFTITGSQGRGANQVLDALREIGVMGKLSYDKYIPEVYFTAPVEQRLALLKGLMDTDGTIGNGNQFSSSSIKLAYSVKRLVEGLGGCCRVKTKIPTYTYKGKKLFGHLHYTLNFRLPKGMCPFQLPRKIAIWEETYRQASTRRIVAVTPSGTGEATCIKVAAENSLFLCANHVVTHNTQDFSIVARVLLNF